MRNKGISVQRSASPEWRPKRYSSTSVINSYQTMRSVSIPAVEIPSLYEAVTNGLINYVSNVHLAFSSPMDNFLQHFNPIDRTTIQPKLGVLSEFPFVADIQYSTKGVPTVTVKLSEFTRENEDKIYSIEYDLINEIDSDIEINIQRP